jgi:hypothetical protein
LQTVSALFDTYVAAIKAVHALQDAGLTATDISLIANSRADLTPDPDPVGRDSVAGAELGAVLGAGGGLLAGLGIVAIPAIGPAIAGGWLVATIAGALAGAGLGAAAGGLLGVLTDAGIPRSDAHVYAEGLRRGGTLVSVRVPEGRVEAARRILAEAGSVDVSERRELYRLEGWTAFEDEPLAVRKGEEAGAGRDRTPPVPPVPDERP